VVASSPVLEDELLKGSVGFVSQSGAFGFVTFHQAQDEHVGFTYLVTTGNEAVLGTADLIEYMVEDDATKVIICYMEGLKDGEKFKAVAKKALEKRDSFGGFQSWENRSRH
jgi:acetate---CoA ligase (ADP-forming)